MSPKNETATLALALLVTVGLIGGGSWWFMQYRAPLPGVETSANLSHGNPIEQLASFAEVPNVPAGLFNHGGSTTWAPIRRDTNPAIQIVWTKFQLRYTDPIAGAPGSGSGIRMLLDNQLAFSESSRPLKEAEYQQAEQRGFRLQEIPVAIDGIALAINPDLNVEGITLAQLKDIYTGKITNWNQVGGPDRAITPYSRRPEEGGTVEFFVNNVLGGETFGSVVTYIPTTTQALREVAANPGGLYYASAPEVVDQCTIRPLPLGRKANEFVPPYQPPRVLPEQCPNRRNHLNASAFQSGAYPITRRLFVIVKQNGQIDQQAGEAYANLLLTNQGQELIAKAGFVRIR
jgi:phosphate transport system substrate-binding protein